MKKEGVINPGLLQPHLVQKIWGGSRLSKMKSLEMEKGDPLGETWEVSSHPDGPSLLQGQKLSELFDQNELPYLVKFLDTDDFLSVQVHPDDEYAKKHENQLGKTECWIILKSDETGGLYLGLKDGVDSNLLEKTLAEGGDVSALMKFYSVKAGDFFYVPAGSIHAIGKGVTLVEIQQSSGVTYRVWDWNRVDENGKGRELHVSKALDVINFESDKNSDEIFKIRKNLFKQDQNVEVVNHPQFSVTLMPPVGSTFELENETQRHWSLIALNEQIEVDSDGRVLVIPAYHSFLIPIGSQIRVKSSQGHFLLVK